MDAPDVSGVRRPGLTPPPVSVGSLLRGSGPRFARDAAAPIVAFYIGWKLFGLGVGITAGTVTAIALFLWERTRSRSGLGAAVGLGIAVVQAIVGFLSGTAIGYLAPPVFANGLYGLAFLVSTAIGRPLAGVFAAEVYPFPPELRGSLTFRRTFSVISVAWGATFLVRCVVRLLVLFRSDVDVFIVVNLATGLPLNIVLLVWSFRYAIEKFRRTADPPADARPAEANEAR